MMTRFYQVPVLNSVTPRKTLESRLRSRAYMRAALLAVFSLGLTLEVARADNYYVNASSGSNTTGNGTLSTPWKTITYGLNQISGSNHTLNVGAGTYNAALGETFPILMKNGVSLVGAGMDVSIVDAGASSSVIRCIGIVDASTKAEGFTIKGGSASVGGGFYLSAGSALMLMNNKINGNSGAGIYVENSSPLIKGNQITDNTYSVGVDVTGSTSTPRIVNNVIANNSTGIECSGSSHARILNNTITGGYYGIEISSAKPDSIVNNIISLNSGFGVYETGTTSDPGNVLYNLFHANTSGLYRDEGTTDYYTASSLNSLVSECKSNIESDPLFVDKTNGNYHERAGSPSIDAGDPTFGYVNEPSPNGSRINIGAYGNTTQATTSTPAPTTQSSLYVAATGGSNTTGDGSQTKPWKTITYALGQITGTGHTVHVAAGTYNATLGEVLPIYVANGVSLVGAGMDRSIIDAGTTETAVMCVGIVDSTTRLDGFTITKGTYPGMSGIYISAGSTLQVSNNKITASGGNTAYNLWQGGIYVVNSTPRITSNTISGNSGSGIFVSNCSPTIKNNLITGNEANSYRGGGLTIEGSTSRPIISYNIIVNNSGEGIRCNNSSIPQITNNTIVGNTDGGIQMGGFAKGGASPVIINNILAFNTGYGVNEEVASVTGKVWYNLFYANGSGLYRDGAATDYYTSATLNTGVSECKNNLDGDPLFIDRTNGDYQLRAGSPAINAGDPTSTLDADGSRADIGAFAYQAIPPSAPSLSSPSNGATSQATTLSLSWGSSTNATKYQLQVSTSSGFTTYVTNDSSLTGTSKSVGPLANNATYYWRVRAGNSAGWSSFTGSWSFSTVSGLPVVSTSAATNASSISATVNGSVNPNGSSTTVWFEWGTSNVLSTFSTTSSQSIGSGTIASSVSAALLTLTPSTTYFFRAGAQNTAGTQKGSIVSFTTEAAIVPSPPALNSPVDGTVSVNTRPTLSWSVSAAASRYCLQVSASSSFGTTVFDDSTITTAFRQVGPLASERTYYWRVSAKSASGSSAYSTTRSFRTLAPPTASTISIRSSFTSPGSRPEGLAWDGENLWMIDNLTNIYKMDTLGKVKTTFPGPRFPDNDLTWDGSGLWIGGGASISPYDHLKIDSVGRRVDSLDAYYWPISGLEWDGKFFWIGDYNSSVIHKHSRDGSQILNWSSGAIFGHPTGISYDGINLWVGTSAEGFSKDIFKFSTTGQVVYKFNLATLGLNPTPGSFASLAWDGKSLWYASNDQFTIYRLNVPYYHQAPAVPTLISPSNGATGQPTSVTFSWSESPDASSYRIQVSTSSAFASTVFDDSTIVSTSTAVSGLVPAATYYWRVRAKNSGGISSYSATSTLTVAAGSGVPTVATGAATAVGRTSATLNGTVNPNGLAATASFEWGTSNSLANPAQTPAQSVGSGTIAVSSTANLSGLTAGTTYYFRAVAQNSNGPGKGSIVSFTTAASGALLGEYSPDANTVLLLHMNETSGSTVTDASSFGNTGAATGASVASGRFGNARNFDGTSQYITIPANTSLNQSTYTLEAWIKIPFTTTFEQDIICKGPASDYELRLSNSVISAILTNSNLSYSCLGKTVVTANTWHHVAATCDVSQGKMRVYLDGVKDNETDLPFMPSVKDGQLVIGALHSANSLFFSGLIDEVRISNRARLPQEFNLQLPPTNVSAVSTGAKIDLTWKNAGGAMPLMRYKIYRGADSTNVSLIDSTTSLLVSHTGLTSGARYFYRVSAVDSTGFEGSRSYAASAVFGPAPVVTTTAATNITTTSAALNGSVNPNGLATTASFEWGVDSLFRAYSSTPSQSVGSGTGAIAVKADLSGLTQNRKYYYRVIAQNNVGTTSGSILSFTTTPFLPAATTASASSITANSAVLNGTVNPSGAATTASFEWGTSNTLSSFSATASQSIGSGSTDVAVTANIPSLTSNTAYYYRVVGQNSGGTQKGTIVSFTTLPTSPPTLSSPANNATGQPATVSLVWSAVTGTTAYHLQLSTNSSFTAPLVYEDTALTTTSKLIAGLAENSSYSWRVRAKNAGGFGSWSSPFAFSTSGLKTVTSPGISYPSNLASHTDYRLVSFPGASSVNVSQVFTGSQNTDWRIFRDNGGAIPNNLTELSTSSSLTIGEGYWLLTKGMFNYSRSTTMPQLSSDGTYSLSVRNGWNLIGNPFDVAVTWASVKQLNSVSANLWTYLGFSGFLQSSILEPFKGYYFFSASTSLKIRYPFPAMKIPEAPALPIDWKIQFVLETNQSIDAENYIGVAATARDDSDQLDQEEPPPLFDQPSLSIASPVNNGHRVLLSADYRPSIGDGQVWRFEVSNPQRLEGRIRVLGIETLPAGLEIALINASGKGHVDLRTVREIPITVTGDRTWLNLLIGSKAFIEQQEVRLVPQSIELFQNYPNPFNPKTAISYQLPAPSARQTASGLGAEGSDVSYVTLKVFDPLGKEVAALVSAEQPAGRYQVMFDAGNLPSGVYFYRLYARQISGGQAGFFVDTKKLILVK